MVILVVLYNNLLVYYRIIIVEYLPDKQHIITFYRLLSYTIKSVKYQQQRQQHFISHFHYKIL